MFSIGHANFVFLVFAFTVLAVFPKAEGFSVLHRSGNLSDSGVRCPCACNMERNGAPHRSRPSFREAMHKIPKSMHHFSFSSSHAPVLTVRPGELVHLETLDCFCGAFDTSLTRADADAVQLDYSTLNPVTGPIYVEGAMPGDTLSVTLHDIRLGRRGVARYGPGSGQLQDLVCGVCTRFFAVDKGMVEMVEERDSSATGFGKNGLSKSAKEMGRASGRRRAPISFPSQPMLGVIGVAPEGDGVEVGTMPAGRHGGNLDDKLNTIGATLHLPVKHPGALLSIGDMHASQGDGEIIGTGIEIGGDVLLSCTVLPGVQAKYPITETDTYWATHGVAVMDIPGATTEACKEAASLLIEQWSFTAEDASIFLGVRGDLGLCQAVHPDKGTQIARMVVPKVQACPTPFRCQSEADLGRARS